MKLRRSIESLSVLLAVVAGGGCSSGLYRISTSEEDKAFDADIRYRCVGSLGYLDPASARMYDESEMPVTVRTVERGNIVTESWGLANLLCFISLGVFPGVSGEYEDTTVKVTTPIGEKTGVYRVAARCWVGWIPLFAGFPASAEERDPNPGLCTEEMKRQADVQAEFARRGTHHYHDSIAAKAGNDLNNTKKFRSIAERRLVDQLVKQFSMKDYVALARGENAKRRSELDRIGSCKQKVSALLAENRYDEAEALLSSASLAGEGSMPSDASVWNGLKEQVASQRASYNRQEELRRTEERFTGKKRELETLLSQGKYEEVLRICETELSQAGIPVTGRYERSGIIDPYFGMLREHCDSAQDAIARRDRDAELARIEARKVQIGKLLQDGDFEAARAECDKERGTQPGSRTVDALIWDGFRREVAKRQLDQLMARGEFDEVLKICDGSASEWMQVYSEVLVQYRSDAKAAIDRRTREAEVARIGKRRAELEKLLRYRNYSAVIAECEKETGDAPGSAPEDAAIWDGYRDEALAALEKIGRQEFEADLVKADQGDAEAQFRVGEVYRLGKFGVAVDFRSARKYYRMAYDNGYKDAWKALDSLR